MANEGTHSESEFDARIDRYFEWLDSEVVSPEMLRAYQGVVDAIGRLAAAMHVENTESVTPEFLDSLTKMIDPETDRQSLSFRERSIDEGKSQFHFLGWLTESGFAYVFGRLLARACVAGEVGIGFEKIVRENVARGFSEEAFRR